MPRSFVEVTIDADPSLAEVMVGMMTQLGFEGYWEEGTSLKCYMSAERWSDALRGEVESIAAVLTRTSSSAAPHISLRTIPEENWNEQWERSIRPIHVTGRVVVTPTWQEYAAGPDEVVVTINPKMSFGTGYHESTRLAMTLVELFLRPGMTVLDIGTGTGILAIAAVRLGASRAVGVDTDEWAFANAAENVLLNGVQEKVRIVQGDLGSVGTAPYDLVVANIQRNVIQELLPEMKTRLKAGGFLVLAGLLVSDREPMEGLLRRARFDVIRWASENDWIALACTS